MMLYAISDDYITYLLKTDARVMFNKDGRPYLGVVLKIDGQNWYVPLSSPKEDAGLKPSFVWLYAIYEAGVNSKINGYLFFRNMIPAPDCAVSLFDFQSKGASYENLINKQHIVLKSDADKIAKDANTFYKLIIGKRSEELLKKSCDFQKLTAACAAYKCPGVVEANQKVV
ncbi:hypothetical protein CS062_00475 [Roseateles chitinivorans]|uniref:Type III toxin-antitoxin system ToxN/AbiQ family toxin n=1 Tax=Roseateles chitinivorans TaxID=2917965 RepID=A0A2G9CFB1_9BURK|nr:type III toxin-antitoxin system ToxN/AbiQ family toxin [Roseateles chitinivorans]PIM55045.1 hypothetical protein CS062_00475 [Roseateles chitinivorans]